MAELNKGRRLLTCHLIYHQPRVAWTQALEFAGISFTTWKTGKAVAIFANSASGASLFTGTWGRAPGARCRYALKIGARISGGTSSRWTSSRPLLLSAALPLAARTF